MVCLRNFDDSGWKTLKSGQSWQQQNVEHYGWGWYRQPRSLCRRNGGNASYPHALTSISG